MSPSTKSSGTRPQADWAELAIAIACGLAITSTALFLGVMPFVRHLAGARDFVVYWATGQQLIHHADPFDPVAMGAIERAAGYAGKAGSYYMRNPPWSLPLALPLGLIPVRYAALPWSLFVFGLLVISVRTLLPMLPRRTRSIGWLGYAFPPALTCVIMGQTSLFLLLGLVLFLRLYRTRPFLAGASLWLCTLKPHVLLPFAVVLLAWILFTRSYRILLGAVTALAVSCALTLSIDPAAFSEYAHWAGRSGISHEFIPCLAVALRDLVNPEAKWIVFLPSIPACAWALVWFWRRRDRWEWMEQGNLLVLVSLLTAPYCWLYDQSLALPALLWTASRLQSRPAAGAKALLAVLAAMYLVLEVQPLCVSWLDSRLYLWPAPMWLAWTVAAQWWLQHSREAVDAEPLAVPAAAANA